MGLCDYVSSAIETISGVVTRSRAIVGGAFGKARAAAPDLSGAWKNTRDVAKVASEATVETSQAVVERMPDREEWQRIGRLVWRIADHAIEHGTKPLTGNIPVYRIVKEELSKNKSQEQPVKEKTENSELAELKATIQNLEKEILDVKELRLRMESLEKKLVEIKQNDINRKGEKKQPVKEKTENSELAELKATIQNLEKENLNVKELRLRMESLEKKLVEIKQNDINQKGEKKQPVKEKTENSELAELKVTIQNLEKENLDVKELRLRMESLEKKLVEIKQNMESLEKKLVEIKQNDINQKDKKRSKL